MHRKLISGFLIEANRKIAARQADIDRYQREMDLLEYDHGPVAEARGALRRLKAVHTLNSKYCDLLARKAEA